MTKSFICLGAQKAGTKWLADMIFQHPDTFQPGVKELHFFDNLKNPSLVANDSTFIKLSNYRRRLLRNRLKKSKINFETAIAEKIINTGTFHISDYMRIIHYDFEAGRMGVDITPAYGAMPLINIQFMHNAMRSTKFIYIIRDPLERSISGFRHSTGRALRKGYKLNEQLIIDQAVYKSKYSVHVNNYDKVFKDSNNLLYLSFKDLKNQPLKFLQKVENFLGLAPFKNYNAFDQPSHETQKLPVDSSTLDKFKRELDNEYEFLKNRFGPDFL